MRAGRVDKFFLQAPIIGNVAADQFFQNILRRLGLFPKHGELERQVMALGERCSSKGDITRLGDEAEAHPPRLIQYGPWGHRIDHIEVSPAWKTLQDISAQEGLVQIGYDRAKYGELARVAQFSKMFVFYAASAVFSCPLAMADGAARVLEVHGGADAEAKTRFAALLSRDPKTFITSGQHMTERTGGSDVSNSETIAIRQSDGSYVLQGYKFFTSATTSAMAVVLARIVDPSNQFANTSKLSCFLLPMERNSDGTLKGILVHTMKEKLGTRAVPTAELEYCGVRAFLLGMPGRGVPTIAAQFNITRWQNAVHCVSQMHRIMSLVRSHAQVRHVFGGPLSQNILHLETLAEMELETRAATLLVAHTSLLLGQDEFANAGPENASSAILRLLTPIGKLYTAKQGMFVASEGIEALGGVGYLENSSMPRFFRDMQVAPVWEGTTNVLSLDIWRAIAKERSLKLFLGDVKQRVAKGFATPLPGASSQEITDLVNSACAAITAAAGRCEADVRVLDASARHFAFALARVFITSLFVEHAAFTRDAADIECVNRWARRPLGQLVVDTFDRPHQALSKLIAKL